jgi:hypothetical protein
MLFSLGRERYGSIKAAEAHIEETGKGSLDELFDTNEAFERALTGPHAGSATPQVHQMLGHATIQGASPVAERHQA